MSPVNSVRGDAAADAADSYFQPREAAWFRARLAARLAVPLDRHARTAALKVAGSAALAAPPIMIALIAPTAKLTAGTSFALFCAAVPGLATTAWASAGLGETRRLAARALHQSGAEQRFAWLIATARLSLSAGLGALAGCAFLALSHAPLGSVLPRNSPLRGMFVATPSTWAIGTVLTTTLAIGEALLASSPVWRTVDWNRFTIWRRVSTPTTALLGDVQRGLVSLRRIRAPRGPRPPQ